MEKKVNTTETRRQEQLFALIKQAQERTRQEFVAELEDAIAEAVTVAKQTECGMTKGVSDET